jgi:CBS domain-containing protein
VLTSVNEVTAPSPLTIEGTTSIDEAAQLMRARDVREVLVTDHHRLLGVLTDSDIVVLAIAAGRPPSGILAGEACTSTPHLRTDQPVREALATMRRHHLRRAPVVDPDGQLVGTAWITDVAAAAAAPRGHHHEGVWAPQPGVAPA